jgi:PAS domain S-box-containing protein
MGNIDSRTRAPKNTLPLQILLVVPLLLQIILAVGVTGWLSWRNGERSIEDVAVRYKNEVAARIQQHIQTYLAIPEPINRINASAVSLQELNLQNKSAVERYIWRQMQLFSSVDSIAFGTETGEYIGIERLAGGKLQLDIAGQTTNNVLLTYRLSANDDLPQLIKSTPNYDPRIRPWYAPAIANGRTTWSPIFQKFNSPQLLISKATPLKDVSNKVIGVTAVDLSISEIDSFLQSIKVGESGLVFIMDRSGTLVASSSLEKPFVVEGARVKRLQATESNISLIRNTARQINIQFKDLKQIQSPQALELDIDRKTNFLQLIPLQDDRGIDWLIAIVIPERDFLAQIHSNNVNTILLCLLFLGIAIGFGVLTSKWIAKPIQNLVQATEEIADGQLDRSVKVPRIRELGLLSRSFNRMAAQLRESFQNLAQANEELEMRVEARTQDLRQSEKKFAQIFLSSPNPTSIVRMRDRQVVEVNDSALKFFGYVGADEADSSSLRLDIWEDERERREVFQILKETGSVRNREYTFHTKSGEPRTVLYSGEIIELNDEPYLLGILNDISDRKQLEMELWRSQKFLDSIIENIPLAVYVKDASNDFRTEIWNKASEDMFGITKRAIFWRRAEEFYSPKQASFFIEGDLEAIQTASTIEIPEAILETVEKGSLVLRTLKVPVFNENGQEAYLICISEDISDRKQTEIALQKAKETAEVANRAKSEFLANMSHELRTPLNGILGYVQILKRHPNLSSQQEEGLNIIQQCGEHLLTLIGDILDISKIEARRMELHPQSFNLLSFLHNIANMFEIRAEQKGIAFDYVAPTQLPAGVNADEQRLRQILINLLGNAVKFTDRGRVHFQVRVLNSTNPNSIKVRFQVDDTGSGISSDQLEAIFLPFQQVGDSRRMTEGTGLGLAISKKLVEMMDGKLQVSSTLGQGSSFWFDLDLQTDHNFVDRSPNRDRQIVGYRRSPDRTALRVLIADDKRENRLVLSNLLKPLGFETMEVVNGAECLQKAIEFKPDLILLDLVMPVMDGFEATRQLRRIPDFQETTIFAVSASVFGSDREASIDVGCNAFIPKPVRAETLLEHIKTYLGLEWEYKIESTNQALSDSKTLEKSSITAQNSKPVNAIPDPEILNSLLQLAMMGDALGIEDRVTQIEQQDNRFIKFTDEIRQLAKGFQIKQIQALLKIYLTE